MLQHPSTPRPVDLNGSLQPHPTERKIKRYSASYPPPLQHLPSFSSPTPRVSLINALSMIDVLVIGTLSVSSSVALAFVCYWLYAMARLPRLESLSNIVDEFSEQPDERDVRGAFSAAACEPAASAQRSWITAHAFARARMRVVTNAPLVCADWARTDAIPKIVDLPVTYVSNVLFGTSAVLLRDAAAAAAAPAAAVRRGRGRASASPCSSSTRGGERSSVPGNGGAHNTRRRRPANV